MVWRVEREEVAVNFFPDLPPTTDEDELEESPQPPWMGAPDDILPGVVPVELIIGRSDSAVVMLTGMRAYPTGLGMRLGVRVHRSMHSKDLNDEVFGYTRDMGPDWPARRLKWGFELADGRRVTNVDPFPPFDEPARDPDRPVLSQGGGGGGSRSVDADYWLWPLPPAGPLRVACQWLEHGIELSVQELKTQPFLDATARARPIWPDD
jgi:hypothetical protein